MKILGFLIITAALVLGVAVSPTAYVPPLDMPDEQLVGLTLNSSAGLATPEVPPADPAAPGEPIAETNTVLTAELLDELRANGVERVRVKEFSFGRWTGKWWFLLAVVGLFVGAALVRMDMRQRLAASREGEGLTPGTNSPDASLAAIIEAIESLRRDLPHMTTEHDREAAIIERLGEVQAVHVPAFVDSRESIVSARGLAGYAAVMDRFAAMERQINRAWSAAADAVDDEAQDCIERASALAVETKAALEPR
ncbi:MAG: hypothetical protein RIE77_11065 [Phycisphaerales bacterium]|jgi:hypothetical protein